MVKCILYNVICIFTYLDNIQNKKTLLKILNSQNISIILKYEHQNKDINKAYYTKNTKLPKCLFLKEHEF